MLILKSIKNKLAGLKTEVNKLGIDKSIPVLVDLIKLRDVVRNSVAKKTDSEKLVAKVNKVNTSAFVLKTKYDTDQSK